MAQSLRADCMHMIPSISMWMRWPCLFLRTYAHTCCHKYLCEATTTSHAFNTLCHPCAASWVQLQSVARSLTRIVNISHISSNFFVYLLSNLTFFTWLCDWICALGAIRIQSWCACRRTHESYLFVCLMILLQDLWSNALNKCMHSRRLSDSDHLWISGEICAWLGGSLGDALELTDHWTKECSNQYDGLISHFIASTAGVVNPLFKMLWHSLAMKNLDPMWLPVDHWQAGKKDM